MRMLVFGDSITLGFWDTEGGWVQRLSSILYEASLDNMLNGDGKSYIEVYNLGISGDTTEGVLKRIKQEVEARRTYPQDEVLLLAIGLNDSILDSDNRAIMDVYKFQEAYEKLMHEALEITKSVFCVGLTAVDESLTSPCKFSSSGKQYRNNRINLFEDAIKQSCERLSVQFIPIHDEFLARLETEQELLVDGLHPNDAGHAHILSVVSSHVISE